MNLVTSERVPYSLRTFYKLSAFKENDIHHVLVSLWAEPNLSIDPNYLPFKSLKTNIGELLIRVDEFKTREYLLKFVGRHFVFIRRNERKVIPLCSHSQ